MKNALKLVDGSGSETLASETSITEEAIARRAFEKWQARGCPLWDDTADWFAAKSELEAAAKEARKSAPPPPSVRPTRATKRRREPARASS